MEVQKLKKKILFFANVDWFFISHRIAIASAAIENGYEVHVMTLITDKLKEMQSHGIIVHPIKLSRGGFKLFDLIFSFWECVTLIRMIKPEILHLVTIKPIIIGGIIARILKINSVIFAISGFGSLFVQKKKFARLKQRIVRTIYSIVFRHPNIKVIVQNNDDWRQVASLGASATDINLIQGSGVDLQKYFPQKKESDVFTIVMASRLLADKGVWDFLDAITILHSQLLPKHAKIRAILAGSPDPTNPSSISFSELAHYCDETFLEVVGEINDTSVMFQNSDIVVLPSHREGMPKVLLEAAACGATVVTTDAIGCREAVLHQKTGLIVPLNDPIALANAMFTLYSNPDVCRNLGEQGAIWAADTFNIDKVINQHMTIYNELSDTE